MQNIPYSTVPLDRWGSTGVEPYVHMLVLQKKKKQNNVPINLSFNKGLHRKETGGQREPKREENKLNDTKRKQLAKSRM